MNINDLWYKPLLNIGNEYSRRVNEMLHKVYIKVNENHEIVEINSDVFINDYTGFIYLDEGYGDKYIHAQGNYFDKPIVNEDGIYNYLYINGKVYER